jgi:hypothetical protein
LSVGPAEKATQVNEQRPTVADAPNGYLSGSLGKRVSKPMLSSSNDRSSANCRFESCRPHHLLDEQASVAELCFHLPPPTTHVAPVAKLEDALHLKRGDRRLCRFDSGQAHHGSLAQLAWSRPFPLVRAPALNRQVEGSIPSRSTTFMLGLRLAAGHRALTARTQVRILEPQPHDFRCHVNSAARVLACLARSHGFESRTWRQIQCTDSSAGRAPG